MTGSRPLRIGIDGRWMSDCYPGIGRVVHNLLRTMPAVAPEESFVVPVAAQPGPVRFNLTELEGCDVVQIPAGLSRTPRGQLAMRRLVRNASLDLFHATYFPGGLGVQSPKVVTIYDVIPEQFPDSIPAHSERLLYRLALRRALTSASTIFTLTRAVRQQLIEMFGVRPNRIVVTPWAPEPRFTPVSREALTALRRRLALPDRYLLYLGFNKPHKNLRRLVEAWSIAVHQGVHGYGLVFAGGVDERFPPPGRLVEEMGLDQIVVLGKVDEGDLPALLGGAGALLQPSLWEGLGLPVLEAMACGVPVACSDIAPFQEIAGDAAVTFDPLDTRAMAAVIKQLIGDPELRSELGQRGRERVRQFSWRRTAELTLETYREAVGRP